MLFRSVEQSVALCTTPLIPASWVQQAIQSQHAEFASFEDARRGFEREYLTQLLKITEGNVTQAARLAKRNRTETRGRWYATQVFQRRAKRDYEAARTYLYSHRVEHEAMGGGIEFA